MSCWLRFRSAKKTPPEGRGCSVSNAVPRSINKHGRHAPGNGHQKLRRLMRRALMGSGRFSGPGGDSPDFRTATARQMEPPPTVPTLIAWVFVSPAQQMSKNCCEFS
jgi:hypothetical protein